MAARTGTQLFAKATIADDTIPAQVADQSEINGGWHSVSDIAARDATALQYRRWGMVVNVENDTDVANNKQWILTRPSSGITDDDAEALMDNGNWVFLPSSDSRFLNAEPEGGWRIGDIWFLSVPDGGNLYSIRKITAVNPDLTSDELASVTSVVTSLYGPLNTGTGFFGLSENNISPSMVMDLLKTEGATRHRYEFTGESVQYVKYVDNVPAKRYETLPKLHSKNVDPTTDEVPDGTFSVWLNTTTGDIKMWVNNGDILKSMTFS